MILVSGAAVPSRAGEDGRRSRDGERGQHGLPPDREHPGDAPPASALAVDAEHRAAEHHRGRRSALARQRDDPAEQERDDDADDADDRRLPERDAEAEDERAVAMPNTDTLAREPRPEQAGAAGPSARSRRSCSRPVSSMPVLAGVDLAGVSVVIRSPYRDGRPARQPASAPVQFGVRRSILRRSVARMKTMAASTRAASATGSTAIPNWSSRMPAEQRPAADREVERSWSRATAASRMRRSRRAAPGCATAREAAEERVPDHERR